MKEDILILWKSNREKLISCIRKEYNKADCISDILQEVFIKFWENFDTINQPGKISQWLISVTKHTIADHLRAKYRDQIDKDSQVHDCCEVQESESLTNTDESKKLLPIIHSLPQKYANILLLSDIHSLPHKEISNQFGLTLSCVKKRVERGRKLLAEKMHECCVFSHDKYGNIIDCSEKRNYLELLKSLKKEF